MEIQRAANLGLLHQKLGIAPEDRVAFKLTESGVVVWDLQTETKYVVTVGKPIADVSHFQLPQNIRNIITEKDDQLKARWSESWMDGWSDERETIFTELTYRGVSVLGL